MIDSSLKQLDDKKRNVIQSFISELLSGGFNSSEFDAVWDGTGSDFFIEGDEGKIALLKTIQERIQPMNDKG
jgi:hypothetical protein